MPNRAFAHRIQLKQSARLVWESRPGYAVILPRNIPREVQTQLIDLAHRGAMFRDGGSEVSFL